MQQMTPRGVQYAPFFTRVTDLLAGVLNRSLQAHAMSKKRLPEAGIIEKYRVELKPTGYNGFDLITFGCVFFCFVAF